MVLIFPSSFALSNIPVSYWLVAIAFVASLWYLWKRFFGKAKVNCWFCNTNCYVRYCLRNQWFCPNCHQYNGFTASGDYNSSIPKMHHEHLNSPNVARPVTGTAGTLIDQPINLCAKCSRNQLLKVKQMSQFEPIREENFQQEAKAYEKKLDKLYSLCEICQDATNRHIKMQDTIIRGSMLSRKRLNMKQAVESTNTSDTAVRVLSSMHWSVNTTIWALVFASSSFHTFNIISYSLNYAINPLSFFGTFKSDVSTDIFSSVSLTGFACSIMGILTERTVFRVNVCCAALWFVHCFIVPWFNILDAIQTTLSPSAVSFQAASKSIRSSVNGESQQIPSGAMLILYFSSLFALIVVSSISLYKSTCKDVEVAKSVSPSSSRFAKIVTRQQRRKVSAEQDDDLYSDCSMPSEDEASAPVPKRQHINNNDSRSMDPGLNGSLLALNLQDAQQSVHVQGRQPPSNGTFTSALHTPPPSRSSSLLSLSSHHSGHNYFTGNTFNNAQPSMSNQLEFAKPYDCLPFSRYKSYTTVTGGQTNKRALDTKSTVSYPVSGPRNSHDILKPFERPHSSKQNSRPLISPAKLNWRGVSQRKRTFDSSGIFKKSPFKSSNPNWEQKSSLDVSFHDSVSQTGENYRPELSDDEDHPMYQTPHRRRSDIQNDVDMNSSSPKSVISNLSSVTMKGIEEVENSRICKWIMFGCLLLNLVLIVLLIWDVKEIRDSQNWKSHSTKL